MSGLPKGWVEASILDTVADYETTDPRRTPDQSFLYVDIGAIDNSVQKITAPKEFLGREAPSRARRVIKTNDVLFSTVRTYLKNVAQVPEELDNQLTSTGISVLRANDAIEPGYLFRWVGSPGFIDEISQAQDGTMYPAVRDDDVLNGPISLPPLPEQLRIVKKLETLSGYTTNARAHLTAIARLTERYKNAALDARLPSPNTTLDSRLVSTFYGPRFSKEAYVQVGGVPTIRTTDFSDDGTATTDLAPRVEVSDKDLEKWKLHGGDILVTRTGSIGKCALFEDDDAVALPSAYLIRVRVDTSVLLPRFAFLYFVSPSGQKHLGVSTQAVAQPNINAAAIRSLPIAIVPIDQQREIIRRIETDFAKIDRLVTESEKALKLTDRLDQRILAKAFSGELVPQDPNDEPASELLARIREARADAPRKSRQRRTKVDPMKTNPKELLLADSAEWPKNGLPFEEIAKRVILPHDDLRDALFDLLGGAKPKLEQVFNKDEARMRLRRVTQ
ncbi:restriction endonuclease subunit S [Thalassospiraceae bacterium LMO-SO8]|nr:restriction endonuclease subunit S [Alphaproteobacteria bacterium LMO-S08]WND76665.1 restriction endonuclease subunit S [Thalassospiraceae bacterium LMO-SO8]